MGCGRGKCLRPRSLQRDAPSACCSSGLPACRVQPRAAACPFPACLPHASSRPPDPRRRSCVPSPLSAEAGLIYTQSVLLILRSLLTEYISRLEGRAGRWIIAQNAPQLTRTLLQFVAVRRGGGRGEGGGGGRGNATNHVL